MTEVKETGKSDGSIEYFCEWRGEPAQYHTWEPAANVLDSWGLHLHLSEAERRTAGCRPTVIHSR